MPDKPEQFELNFEGGDEQSNERKGNAMEIHENDECQACGNAFEGAGSCFQCRGDKRKINWRRKQEKAA